MRNYDTTTHKPYPRVTEVLVRYAASGVPTIEYVEQMAVVDGDGRVQHLADGATRHTLDLSQITEPVQIVHPETGAAIPGQVVTQQQLMLGILAFLRADQVRRDTPVVVEASDVAGPAQDAAE